MAERGINPCVCAACAASHRRLARVRGASTAAYTRQYGASLYRCGHTQSFEPNRNPKLLARMPENRMSGDSARIWPDNPMDTTLTAGQNTIKNRVAGCGAFRATYRIPTFIARPQYQTVRRRIRRDARQQLRHPRILRRTASQKVIRPSSFIASSW